MSLTLLLGSQMQLTAPENDTEHFGGEPVEFPPGIDAFPVFSYIYVGKV
jgi:hypothetical protein